MKYFANTHSFIVRIWFEPREQENYRGEWRGVIEHVATHEKRYFQNLEAIGPFISQYLDNLEDLE